MCLCAQFCGGVTDVSAYLTYLIWKESKTYGKKAVVHTIWFREYLGCPGCLLDENELKHYQIHFKLYTVSHNCWRKLTKGDTNSLWRHSIVKFDSDLCWSPICMRFWKCSSQLTDTCLPYWWTSTWLCPWKGPSREILQL